ncbi:hypothetical protein [Flavobacterium enshiense]|uniref:Uncharacterized protein n=2 Tax=Flavobacterium TaxID=237 RepID=A0A0A2MWL7_9FLAO|nr:hypothetical protein [Flavobacterium enshiense]KGO96714.1 hypothetical protein Q767_03125 [Flavobacterium enshiense DK69]
MENIMEKEVFNSLAKRTLFFSKVIFTFLIISLLIFINFLDLKEKTRDSRYLIFLKNVYDKGDENLGFENFELERVTYLENKNRELSLLHINSRNKLVRILNGYGAPVDRTTKGGGEAMNKFILMANQSLLKKNKESIEKLRNTAIEMGFDRSGYRNTDQLATVDSAITMFKKYSASEKAYFVKGIDTTLLIQKLDSAEQSFTKEKSLDQPTDLNQLNNQPNPYTEVEDDGPAELGVRKSLFSYKLEFKSVCFYENTLVVSYSERQGPSQGRLQEYFIKVPIKVDSLTFPSILHFAGFDKIILNELTNHKNRLNQLKSTYGYYQLKMVDSMASQELIKNNDTVSILGFDISRRWFPLAMFLVLTIIYCLLYETLNRAKQLQYKIISEYTSDETLEFMVDKKVIRFSIWVITPLLLLILALYSSLVHYSFFVYGVLLLCMLICSILGFVSYKTSLRL